MSLAATYKKLSGLPLGAQLFTWLMCLRAPYFSSISPTVISLSEHEVSVLVKKKRKVLNHINTIHAIAICNACELSVGLLMETGLPKQYRWIPKEMKVAYLNKAETDIIATAKIPDWNTIKLGDNEIIVAAKDKNQKTVVEARINIWVSEKKKAVIPA